MNCQSLRIHRRRCLMTTGIILSWRQGGWWAGPRSCPICWCRGWRRGRWRQRKYLWTCRWGAWPPRCRRTPPPYRSPRRSRSETAWRWPSGWSTAPSGRRIPCDRAGWGTSSRGRGLRWSCPSCWPTCSPLPGPSRSSHPRPPGDETEALVGGTSPPPHHHRLPAHLPVMPPGAEGLVGQDAHHPVEAFGVVLDLLVALAAVHLLTVRWDDEAGVGCVGI